jgi:hypothetical protein
MLSACSFQHRHVYLLCTLFAGWPFASICIVQVAVLAVDESGLSSSSPRVPLGPVAAQMELLRGRGYAPAVVAAPEFSALPDSTAKAKWVAGS